MTDLTLCIRIGMLSVQVVEGERALRVFDEDVPIIVGFLRKAMDEEVVPSVDRGQS